MFNSGPWSDESMNWTPEIREICKLNKKNDGTFYMDINDFI